jgi:eukaryotic-like serine/threonine-protein kinase
MGRAAFSPDGQWLAYQSDETGAAQIFVQPFPATGAKYPVTQGGHPFWSPDGRELAFNPAAGRIDIVSITTRPGFSFGVPAPLQEGGSSQALLSRNPAVFPRVWDFMPDGKRLIGVAAAATADSTAASVAPETPEIQVVLNWFEDLKQRMATR